MKRALLALAAAALLLPAEALAQDKEAKVKLVDTGESVVADYDDPDLRVYVGHYGFDFVEGTGYSGLGSHFDAWCVDFQHAVSVGNSWWVDFTNLATGNLGHTRLGAGGGDKYAQAAWLTLQMLDEPTDNWGAMHAAIWNIVQGGEPTGGDAGMGPGGGGLDADDWGFWYDLALMESNFNSIDRSQFAIMTHRTDNGAFGNKQEFLVPVTPVPEPATVLLLATGLLGVLVLRRRRAAVVKHPSDERV